jgi:hypothetical protein
MNSGTVKGNDGTLGAAADFDRWMPLARVGRRPTQIHTP